MSVCETMVECRLASMIGPLPGCQATMPLTGCISLCAWQDDDNDYHWPTAKRRGRGLVSSRHYPAEAVYEYQEGCHVLLRWPRASSSSLPSCHQVSGLPSPSVPKSATLETEEEGHGGFEPLFLRYHLPSLVLALALQANSQNHETVNAEAIYWA